MDINDLEFVKASLKAIRPMDWDTVAEKSGVPIGTIRKLAYGEVEDPRFSTVEALAKFFRAENAETNSDGLPVPPVSMADSMGRMPGRKIGVAP